MITDYLPWIINGLLGVLAFMLRIGLKARDDDAREMQKNIQELTHIVNRLTVDLAVVKVQSDAVYKMFDKLDKKLDDLRGKDD